MKITNNFVFFWDEVKISKMYMALEEKFSQNKDLMDKILY